MCSKVQFYNDVEESRKNVENKYLVVSSCALFAFWPKEVHKLKGKNVLYLRYVFCIFILLVIPISTCAPWIKLPSVCLAQYMDALNGCLVIWW